MNIIKSQPSIKGIRLRVKATFFGVEWAASQDETFFSGMIVPRRAARPREEWDRVEGMPPIYTCVGGAWRTRKGGDL